MRARLIAAFAAVYLIWGSTYLAIRFAVETLPPLLMASARFMIAGALVLLWARLRNGSAWPNRVEWRVGLIGGGLLLLGGNGGVSWAEQRVPSGIAALLVAVVPCGWCSWSGCARAGRGPGRRCSPASRSGWWGWPSSSARMRCAAAAARTPWAP